MTRKKRNPDEHPDESPKPKRSGPKGRPKSRAKKSPRAKLPDRRELEMAMWGMLGMLVPDESPDAPRGQALELLQQAFRADEPALVVALARQAIELWPNCADAYVLLAEHAPSPKAALELYTKGVEAGRRDIGDAGFEQAAGLFWGILPTRPYMRARLGQAQVLWVMGRRDEAISQYEGLLELNPDDNQGVRYLLAAALLETGRDDELGRLLKRFEEDASASWAYSAALLAFRHEGATPRARNLLDAAKRVNPYVPFYLTGQEHLPTRLPDGIIRGDRSEAVDYAVGYLNGWRGTPGAIEWLGDSSSRRPAGAKKKQARQPKGPTPVSKARLRKLPVAEDVWQADARQLPIWVTVGDRPQRPWIVVVANTTDGFILGQRVYEEAPTPESLWDDLEKIMRSPSEGPARRPLAIEVGDSDAWRAVAEELDAIDVRCINTARPELIDELLRQLIEHISDRSPLPGLLEMPGIKPSQVASFYHAAASFHRAAPWQRVGGSETIKIECDAFESGPWYAVVIGQMGMTLGIALYDDLESLHRIRESDLSDEENARETVALSVTFGRENELPIADLDARLEHGWEIATPDAYPCPVRKERGMMMRPPLAWELRLLEAVLAIIPRFIAEHDRDETEPYIREEPTGAGSLTLKLSWVPGTALL